MDSQKEMTKAGVHRKSPKSSKSTPHSALSNGSFYAQDSTDGPGALTFNEPPSSKLLVPTVSAMKTSPSQRDLTVSSFTGSQSSRSAQDSFSSSQTASITSYSSQTTLISLGTAMEHEESQQEKKTKLKRMYKRATLSTKALARMFSRSPGPGRGSPNSGITKRSSLKTPIPIMPPKDLFNVDPFASSSLASSYGLSPLETKRLSITHKRTGSSPEINPHMSVEIQNQLKRSPSVSSPSGIPTSPLSTLPPRQSQQSSIRGREYPFPVNSSNTSFPLPVLRTSLSSQSLILSMESQATVPRASQNQARLPIPRVPSSGSLRAQARQTLPNPTPEQPPPAVPSSLPYLTPSPTNSSGHNPNIIQRPRSKSVRETQRSRPTLAATKSSPQRSVQKLDMFYDNKHSFISRETPSFLDVLPSQRLHQLVRGSAEPNTFVGAPEVQVVAPSPSVPSMRATFLASDPTNSSGVFKQISRTGSISTKVIQRDLDSSPRIDSRIAETPGKGLELDRLPVPIPRYRKRSTDSSRGPSPAPIHTPSVTGRKPSLPLLVTQNLPTEEDSELSSSNLKSHRSIRHIPRSPSMPSLRPDFINAPALMQATGSRLEKSKTPFWTSDASHIRSPSLPDVALNASSSSVDKEKRQPLPSSITERLKTRTRSYTKNEGRQPDNHSPPSKPLTPPNAKKSLESIASTLAHDPALFRSDFEGSVLSTASDFKIPPPPKVSHLLKLRAVHRPQGSSLKTPSMPDLRQSLSISGSQSRRPSSPPPPLPSAQHHPTLALQGADPHTSRLQGPLNSAYNNDIGMPTVGGSLPRSPLSTAFSRPKMNLTRSNESFSYPPSAQTSHANSNNGFAKENSWDSLGTPPRLQKSLAVQTFPTHVDRKPSYVGLRSRSKTVKMIDPSVLPVSITQVQSNHSRNRMVGAAL